MVFNIDWKFYAYFNNSSKSRKLILEKNVSNNLMSYEN